MKKRIKIALAGNPNSGKTTIFNNLTGTRQHVGNYPGVTVEKKEGYYGHRDYELHIIDLPGNYSLTAYSPEELIARNVIIEEKPDVVINIVDASNIERNFYLTTQLIEMDAPLVIALNMSDVAEGRGLRIDADNLSHLMGAPIVSTIGHKKQGMTELLDTVVNFIKGDYTFPEIIVHYGDEIEEEIEKIERLLLQDEKELSDAYGARWLAVKLLENDKEIKKKIQADRLFSQVKGSVAHLEKIFGEIPEITIAGRRYGFISGACQESVISTVESRHTMSDKIDTVILSPLLGLPIFLALMYLVFQLTFTLGHYPMDWLEAFFNWLGMVISGLSAPGSESPLKSLLVDGVIGGVGGVLVFLPNILILFLAIAVLEDSGYMGRAAFLMDRFMHKIGLHGKSFIPMLIGFGCSVPAIMATRTLESRKDRITTMLVIPLMSCGARLPIYALIIPAFFPQEWNAPMLFIIYLTGIILAIGAVKVIRTLLLRGESTPFVIELPPYRIPTFKSLLIHMWTRGWMYLKKAGTIILAFSIIMWALSYFPRNTTFNAEEHTGSIPGTTFEEVEIAKAAAQLEYSMVGRLGHAIEPVIKPLGFDWKIATSLIGALPAKELFVAHMGVVYSVGQTDKKSDTLRTVLQKNYTPLTGFCIMLFCLIAFPCMATLIVTARESGSWKWALFQFGFLLLTAYVLVFLVHQTGTLLHVGI